MRWVADGERHETVRGVDCGGRDVGSRVGESAVDGGPIEGMSEHGYRRPTLERLVPVGAVLLFGVSLAACGGGTEGSSPEIMTALGPTGATVIGIGPVNDPSV